MGGLMQGQRQKSGGGRRRRRRSKSESKTQGAPILIAARRPDSPLLSKVSGRAIAASAKPKKARPERPRDELVEVKAAAEATDKPRRVARIVQASTVVLDERQARRQVLLERLANCEGRSAISRIADELLQDGGIPEQQEYQLQLLEHVDEQRVLAAISVLQRLFEVQDPIKRPILDRRLRRLEDEADEPEVRHRAAELRRTVRCADPVKPAQAS